MTATAYIALGSNLGHRRQHLEGALTLLRQHGQIEVTKVSSFLETPPVGGPTGQDVFLNAAAELGTDLEPKALLNSLLAIEQQLGRVRQEPWGPRTIDLDLLLYEDQIYSDSELTLPHPRLHERRFVLAPLAEIAPEVSHPILHQKVRELLAKLESPGRELCGRRALVTGATSGIGRAIALELAAAGADVIVHGRRPQTAAEVVGQVQLRGPRSELLLADLAAQEQCCRLVDQAWQVWGGLDIWINNAGADTLTGAAAAWPFDRKLQTLWEVDVRATAFLSRAVGTRMSQAGGGAIVNMGWDQADTGMEGDSGQLFAAVKGAVMAFSKSLALSLAPTVRVNCLAPGWIRTAWGEKASTTWQERVRRETPLARWGTPLDVAQAARWLVSPASGFLTGQVLRVNGGAVRG